MIEGVSTFVNERPVTLPPGACVRDAVARFDPSLADALDSGGAYVTDGVGRRIDPGSRVVSGAIVRVVRSGRGGPHQQGSP